MKWVRKNHKRHTNITQTSRKHAGCVIEQQCHRASYEHFPTPTQVLQGRVATPLAQEVQRYQGKEKNRNGRRRLFERWHDFSTRSYSTSSLPAPQVPSRYILALSSLKPLTLHSRTTFSPDPPLRPPTQKCCWLLWKFVELLGVLSMEFENLEG